MRVARVFAMARSRIRVGGGFGRNSGLFGDGFGLAQTVVVMMPPAHLLQEPDSARSGSHGHGGSRLTEGLAHMLDRARAQAGQCVRALRLEMLLLMIYHLQVRRPVLLSC